MFFKPAYLKLALERRRFLKKVLCYRGSQLTAAEGAAIHELIGRLKSAEKVQDKNLVVALMAESDKLLKRVGGHYYKHYQLFDNVETLVVAAILAIAIRSYFLQPFKIPTNSMWPTYHGMTYTIHGEGEAPLSRPAGFLQFLLQGTTQFSVTAPASGTVGIPVFSFEDRQQYKSAFKYQVVSKKLLGLLPIQERRYSFIVDGQTAFVDVPLEFSLDKLLLEKFFDPHQPLPVNPQGLAETGVTVKSGDPILRFQIETGDMLFVDRFSYHFVTPRIGQPIVFRTRGIPGLTELNGGTPDDKYYIKRLVGQAGDVLEVKEGELLRNAQAISGSPVFDFNNTAKPPYRGYQSEAGLSAGQKQTVPPQHFYAMGDNSYESLDSRYWGAAPMDQLIGKAVFIYYPFTNRWGFSR